MLILRLLRQPARSQFRAADGGAELLHKLRLQATDRKPAAVAGAVVVVEAAAIQRLVFHRRFHASGQIARTGHAVQTEGAVGHADIHLLPLPRGLTLDHRRQQADHPVQRAAGNISRLDPQRQRPGFTAPGVAGDAGQGQVVDVMAGAVLVRAALAVTGNRHIDQLRVDRLERLITDTEFIHHPRTKLLQHDVVLGHQLFDHFHRFRLFQVQGDAALVAVEVGVTGRYAAVMRRQYTHQIHARRRLDPQHLRAHVG